MISQTVFDTSRLLELKGVKHIVLSPGSRNAPLTVSFARNSNLKIYNIVDERSAGFIALGIAQQTKTPVVLCCTSGTSLLNYAPAIAEAYYQQIPLLVISADRPKEWLDQRDGQTINQAGAISNFVKKTYQLPSETISDVDKWNYNRQLNEAVNLSIIGVKGPVHINIPFREPFYPKAGDELRFSENPRIIEPVLAYPKIDFSVLATEYYQYDKRLILAGQHSLDFALNQMLEAKEDVVVADVISNLTGSQCIRHQDLFLMGIDGVLAESLRPELLITFGKSVISKGLKLFLRKFPPAAHWHFDKAMYHADVFLSMTRLVQSDIQPFLDVLSLQNPIPKSDFNIQIRNNFYQNWHVENDKISRKLPEVIDQSAYCEFKVFHQVLKQLPEGIDLHLANSMPVRFANFIQNLKPVTEVFCNRGTSGIDGTNGTAVGHSLVAERPTWLLTGDLSFFYDRNAFFHNYDLSNLKIIVFNNSGGGIFRLIPGPSGLPELEQHFETRHQHSAKFTALEYGFDYFVARDIDAVISGVQNLAKDNKTPKLLEIFTDPKTNSREYFAIKNAIKSS